MLLFTFFSLMYKIAGWFYASFDFMEHLNRNLNIVFILIGATGVVGWLIKQYRFNNKAEHDGTLK